MSDVVLVIRDSILKFRTMFMRIRKHNTSSRSNKKDTILPRKKILNLKSGSFICHSYAVSSCEAKQFLVSSVFTTFDQKFSEIYLCVIFVCSGGMYQLTFVVYYVYV